MNPEYFPPSVSLRTEYTRPEYQDEARTCLAFGITTGLETIFARAGKPTQLSARFLWYAAGHRRTIEGLVQAGNEAGICRDELCVYSVSQLYTRPNDDAFADAKITCPKFGLEQIYTIPDLKRAICHGSPVIMISDTQYGSHCECIDGYDEEGAHVWGSYEDFRTDPWQRFNGFAVTQLYRFRDTPVDLIADSGYREGDLPTFAIDTLTLPSLTVMHPWPNGHDDYIDVVVKFESYGTVREDDPDVWGDQPMWRNSRELLMLPLVIIDGVRHFKVSVIGAKFKVVSYTAVPKIA